LRVVLQSRYDVSSLCRYGSGPVTKAVQEMDHRGKGTACLRLQPDPRYAVEVAARVMQDSAYTASETAT